MDHETGGCRKQLVDGKGVNQIFALLNTPITPVLRILILTLFHNLSFDAYCGDSLKEAGVISLFIEHIQVGDEATVATCLFSLNNLISNGIFFNFLPVSPRLLIFGVKQILIDK